MKSLTNYIEEKLVVNKNYDSYQYHPKTCKELRQIILDRYKEQGPGTKDEPIDFNDIDVSEITTFYDKNIETGIFDTTNFEYIDISDWNVSNVKSISFMFRDCKNLESIGDLSKWDVSNVENINCMFVRCEKLKSIGDISNWDVSNILNMWRMFMNCKNLKSVGDLSDWDVSHVEDMWQMFDDSGIINIPDWYKE